MHLTNLTTPPSILIPSPGHTPRLHEGCSSPIREDAIPAKAYMTDIEHMSMHYRRGGTVLRRDPRHMIFWLSQLSGGSMDTPLDIWEATNAYSGSIGTRICTMSVCRSHPVYLCSPCLALNYLTSSGGWLEILSC